jgi:hypothetical protein
MNANTSVIKNHAALPPKYLKYAFKPTPPFLSLQLFYYEDKTKVVEMYNIPTTLLIDDSHVPEI